MGGDFFTDPLPVADVITMGLILHDWNLEGKMQLIRAAYDSLPDGGVFIVVENLIDDERRENAFGLMMSLNMLIEFGDAFDFTGADFDGWCRRWAFGKPRSFPSLVLRAPGLPTSRSGRVSRVVRPCAVRMPALKGVAPLSP